MKHNRMPMYLFAAAAIAAVFIAAGAPFTRVLPFAVVLLCPLMMIFMMRGMGGMHGAGSEDHTGHGCEHDPTNQTDRSATGRR